MLGNIMDLLQPLLGSGTIDAVSRRLGETPDSTKKALQTALPASISGVADYASNEVGARDLMDSFRSGEIPQLDADGAGRILADPSESGRLAERGEGMLGRFFGNRLGGLVSGISQHAGTSRSTTSKLLGMAMPLVLGVVGKQAISNGLDGPGLSRYLGQQKGLVSSLLPLSIGSLFGRGAVEEAHGPPIRRVEGRGAAHGKSGLGRLLPWALAGLAVILGLNWLSGRRHKAEREPVTTTEPARPEPTTPEVAQPEPTRPPAEPSEIERREAAPVAGRSSIAQIGSYLDQNPTAPKRFVLEGVEFQTGSAELSGEARAVADDLAATLQRHPNAKLRIEGFADVTGDSASNLSLSKGRADSLARYLGSKGVSEDRMQTTGFGEARPIAPGDTEEGRYRNRRVEVVVQPR